MEERRFYKPIGKWLIEEKGCQKDEFCHGYRRGIKGGDTEVGDIKVDLLAMKYEKIPNVIPVFDFIGYIVEVKKTEKEAIRDIAKLECAIREARNWDTGFHKLTFYIAYPASFCSKVIRDMCKDKGIGILLLRIDNEEVREISEELAPQGIQSVGMSHNAQRAGYWSAKDLPKNLRDMFKNPEGFYEKYIKSVQEKYNKESKIRQALDRYLKNRESKEARDFLIEKIQEEFI